MPRKLQELVGPIMSVNVTKNTDMRKLVIIGCLCITTMTPKLHSPVAPSDPSKASKEHGFFSFALQTFNKFCKIIHLFISKAKHCSGKMIYVAF
jgi:hypothetical protein